MGEIVRERVENGKNWLCVKSGRDLWFGCIWIEDGKIKANWGLGRKTFGEMKDLVKYVRSL